MLKLKTTRLLCKTFSVVALCVVSAGTAAYTLQDAVYQTMKHHPDILSAKAESAAAASDVRVAQGGLYPSLDISAGIGRENSNNPATRASGAGTRVFTRRESEALLQQLLYDGGNVRGTVKQRRYQHSAAQHRITELQESLGFAAVDTYHDILRQKALLEVRKLDVSAHRDMLNKVKRSLAAGAGRKSEISLAKSRLALSIARLESTEGELANAQDTFNKVVGRPAPRYLRNPGRPNNVPRSLRAARDLAISINPSIKLIAAQVQSFSAAIGVAESAFFPRFTIDFSATYNDNLDGVFGRNEDKQAMLRMSYNLLRGGSDMAAVRSAQDRERASVEDLANIKRDVNEDVALSWNDLQAAKDRLPYLKQHRDESLAVYDAYVKQFQLGQRTLFDLLNAQSEYYDARINYINGRYDVQVNSYRLLASIGILVETMAQGHQDMESALNVPFDYKSAPPERARYVKQHTQSMMAKNGQTPAGRNTAETETEIKAIMGNTANATATKTKSVAKVAQPKAQPVVAKTDNASRLPYYSLQLFAAGNRAAAQNFIDNNHLKDDVRIETASVNDHTIYRVIAGHYANKQNAWDAINAMPKSLQKLEPLVRYHQGLDPSPLA